MMDQKTEQNKKDAFEARETWPPYTYRDYPDIKPETYQSYMKFLDTENTSNRLMELQPWVSFAIQDAHFATSQPQPQTRQTWMNTL
jgi:hypothetical protein